MNKKDLDMNFVDATKAYFFKWKDFDSRISRSEFWYGNLGALIVSVIIGAVAGFIGGLLGAAMGYSIDGVTTTTNILLLPFYFLLMVAGLSLVARRLHDIDKSGWWYLILLTVIGGLILCYWFCKKGDAEDNRFGPNPLPL